jgi:hypothetical protein
MCVRACVRACMHACFIQCMGVKSNVYRLLVGKLEGKRPLGR